MFSFILKYIILLLYTHIGHFIRNATPVLGRWTLHGVGNVFYSAAHPEGDQLDTDTLSEEATDVDWTH